MWVNLTSYLFSGGRALSEWFFNQYIVHVIFEVNESKCVVTRSNQSNVPFTMESSGAEMQSVGLKV